MSLGLRLRPGHWSKRRQEVTSKADGADRINEALARATATGKQAIAEAAAAAGGSLAAVDVDDIRERAERRLHPEREDAAPSNPERSDLIAYGRRLADRLETEGRIATARAYRKALKKVSSFLADGRSQQRGATLPFPAVTPDLVERFRAWLASPAPHGLGLSPNTVHKHVTSVARIWRLAERDVFLDHDGRAPADPFRRVVVKRVPTKRAKLSAEEVRAIEAVDLNEANLQLARDAWVLALYAGGMRFSEAVWGMTELKL